jgi:hypothetical protein
MVDLGEIQEARRSWRRGALGPVLPAQHLVLAVGRCSAVPGQDLAESDEFSVDRWVKLVGQDQVKHGPRGLLGACARLKSPNHGQDARVCTSPGHTAATRVPSARSAARRRAMSYPAVDGRGRKRRETFTWLAPIFIVVWGIVLVQGSLHHHRLERGPQRGCRQRGSRGAAPSSLTAARQRSATASGFACMCSTSAGRRR